MVQSLVRLCRGCSAQADPLCERKTNGGGGNERGVLEVVVATKGRSSAIEDLSWTKIMWFVLFFHSWFMWPL